MSISKNKIIMAKKIKSYTEGEMIKTFGLTRLFGNKAHPIMERWTETSTILDDLDQRLFDRVYRNATENIIGWQEEELKMQFIAPVLIIANLENTKTYSNFYERVVEDTVDGYFLKTKTDYMIAKGTFGIPDLPYFHFQEYKPHRNPSGDSMGQLLEAFLIAQQKNNNGKPLYGCEVVGAIWRFVILKDRTYCVSKTYDCTERDDLLHIIAVLRHFKHILETELLD